MTEKTDNEHSAETDCYRDFRAVTMCCGLCGQELPYKPVGQSELLDVEQTREFRGVMVHRSCVR